MPDASPFPDPARCPLCGQSNQCAIEAGQPAAGCWCMGTPVDPATLAAVPDAARGLACLCPRCQRIHCPVVGLVDQSFLTQTN